MIKKQDAKGTWYVVESFTDLIGWTVESVVINPNENPFVSIVAHRDNDENNTPYAIVCPKIYAPSFVFYPPKQEDSNEKRKQ